MFEYIIIEHRSAFNCRVLWFTAACFGRYS